MLEKLQDFNSSNEIEVQDRANSACLLIQMLRSQFPLQNNSADLCNHYSDDGVDDEMLTSGVTHTAIPSLAIEIVQEMALLFDGELIPVAPKAERKVPLPDGLDLDEWINPPEDNESSDSSQHDDKDDLFVKSAHAHDEISAAAKRRQSVELTPEQIERNRLARLIEQSNNPHYLKSSPTSSNAKSSPANNNFNNEYDNLDDIPITELNLDIPTLQVGGKWN